MTKKPIKHSPDNNMFRGAEVERQVCQEYAEHDDQVRAFTSPHGMWEVGQIIISGTDL